MIVGVTYLGVIQVIAGLVYIGVFKCLLGGCRRYNTAHLNIYIVDVG